MGADPPGLSGHAAMQVYFSRAQDQPRATVPVKQTNPEYPRMLGARLGTNSPRGYPDGRFNLESNGAKSEMQGSVSRFASPSASLHASISPPQRKTGHPVLTCGELGAFTKAFAHASVQAATLGRRASSSGRLEKR